MKRSLLITLLIGAGILFAAVTMIAPAITSQIITVGQREQQSRHDSRINDGDFTHQDETRQTYELHTGARVEVSSINGTVDVEAADSDKAEVHIIRSARNRDDLNYRKVIVEHTPTRLVVRGESDSKQLLSLLFGRNPQVRQRVVLRVPRQIELATKSVNGRVSIGELYGPVSVGSVNGKVEVRGLVGHAEVSSINGSVTLTIARLGNEDSRGMRVSSVNGVVERRFSED